MRFDELSPHRPDRDTARRRQAIGGTMNWEDEKLGYPEALLCVVLAGAALWFVAFLVEAARHAAG